jgi:hypothetical protein
MRIALKLGISGKYVKNFPWLRLASEELKLKRNQFFICLLGADDNVFKLRTVFGW